MFASFADTDSVVMGAFVTWSERLLYITEQKVDEIISLVKLFLGNLDAVVKKNPAISVILMENIWSIKSSVLAKSGKGQQNSVFMKSGIGKGSMKASEQAGFILKRSTPFTNSFCHQINTEFRIPESMVNFIQI